MQIPKTRTASGYSSKLTAEENVRRGYEKCHNYAMVYKQLLTISTYIRNKQPEAAKQLRKAAELARYLAYINKDFKNKKYHYEPVYF
ncbi:MAG: hypothetical protein M1331_02150 [Candidatus Marsarchaeota archaeon]|nr:hypothetical protein [Candidatus Marsarchaeota archaeon]MCL5106177.1 hypothetical protein [Candidatus Marsarchaeota archaeon]